MMRLIAFVFAAILAVASPGWGQDGEGPAVAPLSALSLDELFAKLPEAANTPAGRATEAEILRRFNESGSDTVDLLCTWAAEATQERDFALALDLLDQAIMLKPDYAEAWNKRATIHYLMDDYSSSLADIRRTLALEPRHFGALSGFGIILNEMGQTDQAIVVFRKALAIDPLLEKVRETLERLEKQVSHDAI